MLRAMAGFLLILLAYGAAFLISMPIGAMLKHLTGNRIVSNAVATGCGFSPARSSPAISPFSQIAPRRQSLVSIR